MMSILPGVFRNYPDQMSISPSVFRDFAELISILLGVFQHWSPRILILPRVSCDFAVGMFSDPPRQKSFIEVGLPGRVFSMFCLVFLHI